jgi:hypothetical protein
MDLSKLRKKLEPILKNDAPNVGELCIVWITGVIAYAIVVDIEPFYMEGWYNVKFVMLRQVPPQQHEWRLKTDHLRGNEFQIDGHPCCIFALNIGPIMAPVDDPNVVKSKSWKEMVDGDRKEDDSGGDGCPNKCDTPCS